MYAAVIILPEMTGDTSQLPSDWSLAQSTRVASLTGEVTAMQSVDGRHGSRDGGTLDVDVSLETSRGKSLPENRVLVLGAQVPAHVPQQSSCPRRCEPLLHVCCTPR